MTGATELKHSAEYKGLIDYYSTCQSEFASLLGEMVAYPTPSGDRTGINRFADHLEELFTRLGATARRNPTSVGDVLELTFSDTTDSSPVLLAHMDTAGVDSTPPAARLDKERMFGHGCYDMKNGIALFYFAARWIYKSKQAAGTGLRVVFTPDEETGGAESLPVVAEICGGTRGVILPEPSCPDGSLKARRKGVAAIEAILSGLAAHSGIEPEKGRDANRALGHLIREIDHGIAEIGEVTFNPGIISGGVRTNVVAPRSRLEGELRSFSNRKLASALDWLAGLRDIGGVEVTMTTRLVHPALEADEKNSRLADIARAVADSLGQPLKCGSSGGASDGSTLSARGIPVVDGLGMRGGGAHAKEEFIEMNDFPFRAALITGLCMEI